jgi:hypothetical protein
MPKTNNNKKKSTSKSASKPLKKQEKSSVKKTLAGAAKGLLTQIAKKVKPAADVKSATSADKGSRQGAEKNSKTSAPKKDLKTPRKTESVSAGLDMKSSKGPKITKTPAKTKGKKKPEQDDDLLVGESDGMDETIEGLDEIEELETEILESAVESVEVSIEETEVIIAAPGEESDEIILTDAEGRRLCQVRDCDQAATVEHYCRFHYLQNWKRIQVRRKILADGKLERYVDELTSRYPDKFLEMIRKDLRTEKDFVAAIAELEIDESGLDNEFEDESQSFIEEVRGVTEAGLSEEEEF